MAEFKLHELITATGGVLLQGALDGVVSGITTDSRRVKPGELFLALRGEKFDGHDFIEVAIRNGAAAIIAAEAIKAPESIAVILTPDTLVAYGAIARFHRERFRIPVIGITGSNGKTTTKDLTAAVLSQKFPIVRTEANFNNEIGLPATLLNITPETEVAIVEMGMRGLGQIRALAGVARPNLAIITNVGLTHLELLGSRENIVKAKAELVEALPPDGVAILNGDDEYVRGMSSVTRARTIYFGLERPDLDYRAEILAMDENGSRFQVTTRRPKDGNHNRFLVSLPISGEHNIRNALAAIAVALELGVSEANIQQGLCNPLISEKRQRLVVKNGYSVIDDTYNASPTSVKAALDVLALNQNGRRKIAVLGDMLELGPEANRIHREIGQYAADIGVNLLFCYGDLAREYLAGFQEIIKAGTAGLPGREGQGNPGRHFTLKTTLIQELKTTLQPGDVILIKGSRGMKMEEIVAALTDEG